MRSSAFGSAVYDSRCRSSAADCAAVQLRGVGLGVVAGDGQHGHSAQHESLLSCWQLSAIHTTHSGRRMLN
jgi:hypothetical protein